MSLRPRSRVLALALSLVPGWGHVYWGRELLGVTIFTAFTVGMFAMINGLLVYLGEGQKLLVRGGLALTGAVLVWNWVDITRRTHGKRLDREADARARCLREGMTAYLRDDLAGAKSFFSSCIKADPLDADALFRLAMVCSRAGDVREAMLWLRRARKCDLERKWQWEVRREFDRLRKLSRAGAPAADAAAEKQDTGSSGKEA